MSKASILALVADQTGGKTLVRSPKVGLWSAAPRNGTPVGPGSTLGWLTQLNRRFAVRVPEGVNGRVEIVESAHEAMPVAYGQALCLIAPWAGSAVAEAGAIPAASAVPRGGFEIVAPTDGVFYRAPAAGAPPYVALGDRVVAGQTMGLIEVMKTFNPIVYGGADLPDEAELVEVVVADEAEVRAGEPLLRVKKR